jgi:hypothetical protein
MFNPKQAQQDFYNIKIAILIIILAISTFVLSSVMGTGIKYIVLNQFGIETTAQVTRMSHNSFDEKLDINSNNSWGLGNDLVVYVKFEDEKSNEINASIFASYKREEITQHNSAIRRFKNVTPYNIHEKIQIIYYKYDPSIFLPVDHFPKFITDRNIMLGSAILILVCSILLFLQIKNYQNFRRKAQYY